MKTKVEQGCTRIHLGMEKLELRFGGRKENNKQVLIVRDDRECYELDKCNKFGEFNRYKNSPWGNNLYFGGDLIGF